VNASASKKFLKFLFRLRIALPSPKVLDGGAGSGYCESEMGSFSLRKYRYDAIESTYAITNKSAKLFGNAKVARTNVITDRQIFER